MFGCGDSGMEVLSLSFGDMLEVPTWYVSPSVASLPLFQCVREKGKEAGSVVLLLLLYTRLPIVVVVVVVVVFVVVAAAAISPSRMTLTNNRFVGFTIRL